MSDTPSQHPGPVVRASDPEREQTVALLQRHFADGRLTPDELEERAGAAYAAQTRAQLSDLTADLPAPERQARPGMTRDPRLLIILLCAYPPAGLVYWLLTCDEPLRLPAWVRERLGRNDVPAGARRLAS
jgi:hypothetical protein